MKNRKGAAAKGSCTRPPTNAPARNNSDAIHLGKVAALLNTEKREYLHVPKNVKTCILAALITVSKKNVTEVDWF